MADAYIVDAIHTPRGNGRIGRVSMAPVMMSERLQVPGTGEIA